MMIPDLAGAARFAANHLWQSTLVACAAAAVAWMLRGSEARLRHGIWMAASLKFLVPFAFMIDLGERLGTKHISAPATPLFTAVLQIGRPFADSGPVLHARASGAVHFPWLACIGIVWAAGAAAVLLAWMVRWQRVNRLVRNARPQLSGREADTLRAAAMSAGIPHPIPLLVTADCMEPGVFGILRPVLLWPRGISAHLEDEQIAAIIVHELCHVRRRDNLLAMVHMCVEAAFWFHPLVWWMGTRLLEERERACDEAVLRLGREPAQYADAILKACRFCVESPLTCVSGVSGSDLKRRMVRIMNAATVPLSRSRKMLLASVAVATLAGPIVLGALHPRVVSADEAQDPKYANLRFDSASLTPSQSTARAAMMMQHNDEFIDQNITMKDLIAMAYGVRPDRIVGGPDWLDTQRFDFEARWTGPAAAKSQTPQPPPPPPTQFAARTVERGGPGLGPAPMAMAIPVPASLQAMMRNFLAEHASLRVRDDSQVMPVYELIVANGGSKLTSSQPQPSSEVTEVRMQGRVENRMDNGQQTLAVTNGPTRVLCDNLAARLGSEVVDKTGLTGRYDFTISFPVQGDADQLASVLRDRYGLDLQSTQQPVKVVAVDNVEMPQSK